MMIEISEEVAVWVERRESQRSRLLCVRLYISISAIKCLDPRQQAFSLRLDSLFSRPYMRADSIQFLMLQIPTIKSTILPLIKNAGVPWAIRWLFMKLIIS